MRAGPAHSAARTRPPLAPLPLWSSSACPQPRRSLWLPPVLTPRCSLSARCPQCPPQPPLLVPPTFSSVLAAHLSPVSLSCPALLFPQPLEVPQVVVPCRLSHFWVLWLPLFSLCVQAYLLRRAMVGFCPPPHVPRGLPAHLCPGKPGLWPLQGNTPTWLPHAGGEAADQTGASVSPACAVGFGLLQLPLLPLPFPCRVCPFAFLGFLVSPLQLSHHSCVERPH